MAREPHGLPLRTDRRAGTMHDSVMESTRARPRTWLVTGVAGFIGSHLLETLLKVEQRVVGLDNFSLGKRENLTEVRSAVSAWAAASILSAPSPALVMARLCLH